jgi:hypothetical protein
VGGEGVPAWVREGVLAWVREREERVRGEGEHYL